MNSPYIQNNKIGVKDITCDILEMFENLLDKYDISIPDEDREEDNFARLSGDEYCKCDDAICNLLSEVFSDVLNNKETEFEIEYNFNGTNGNIREYYDLWVNNLKTN